MTPKPAPSDVFKSVVLSLCARKGIATPEQVRSDLRGVSEKEMWVAFYTLEKAGMASHMGGKSDAVKVTNAFRDYPVEVRIPKVTAISFGLTVAGMKAAMRMLGKEAAE